MVIVVPTCMGECAWELEGEDDVTGADAGAGPELFAVAGGAGLAESAHGIDSKQAQFFPVSGHIPIVAELGGE